MTEEEKNETPETPAAEEAAAEAPAKPARKPRAAKPKAEATEAAPEAEAKPKRTRAAAKPKAEAAADAPKAEAAADAPKAEKPAADKPAASTRSRKAAPKAAETKTDKPAAPARTRRRGVREPGAAIPVVRAQAKYVRSSARKARLVCDNIRGKSVEDARAILAHTPRAVARDWSKLLESAVANAEHNHELVGEDLVIKAVTADEGPTIKRFRPRAMGRATQIRKRTAHLTILLTPKN
jgi:ribosomal protein L22